MAARSLCLLSVACAALAACTFNPRVDANGLSCRTNAGCPPDYVCVGATASLPGVCCDRPDAASCQAPTGGGGSIPASDGPTGGVLGQGGAVRPDGGITGTGGVLGQGGAVRPDGGLVGTGGITGSGGFRGLGGASGGGGAVGSGGTPDVGGRPDAALPLDGSATQLVCPQLPGSAPDLCDFERMTYNEAMGWNRCAGAGDLTSTFYVVPGLASSTPEISVVDDAHSGTGALSFSITAKTSTAPRTGGMIVDLSVSPPSTVYNPYPCLDVSAYTGIEFWTKGSSAQWQIRVFQQTGTSDVVAFSYYFSPPSIWNKVVVPWSALTSTTSGAVFDPARLHFISFDIGLSMLMTDVSLLLDDITFTTGP